MWMGANASANNTTLHNAAISFISKEEKKLHIALSNKNRSTEKLIALVEKMKDYTVGGKGKVGDSGVGETELEDTYTGDDENVDIPERLTAPISGQRKRDRRRKKVKKEEERKFFLRNFLLLKTFFYGIEGSNAILGDVEFDLYFIKQLRQSMAKKGGKVWIWGQRWKEMEKILSAMGETLGYEVVSRVWNGVAPEAPRRISFTSAGIEDPLKTKNEDQLLKEEEPLTESELSLLTGGDASGEKARAQETEDEKAFRRREELLGYQKEVRALASVGKLRSRMVPDYGTPLYTRPRAEVEWVIPRGFDSLKTVFNALFQFPPETAHVNNCSMSKEGEKGLFGNGCMNRTGHWNGCDQQKLAVQHYPKVVFTPTESEARYPEAILELVNSAISNELSIW